MSLSSSLGDYRIIECAGSYRIQTHIKFFWWSWWSTHKGMGGDPYNFSSLDKAMEVINYWIAEERKRTETWKQVWP